MTGLDTMVLRAARQWTRVNIAVLISRAGVSDEQIIATARRLRIPVSTKAGTTWLIGKSAGRAVSGPQGFGKVHDNAAR